MGNSYPVHGKESWDELGPEILVDLDFEADSAQTNRVQTASANSFTVTAGTYPAYDWEGPANDAASPIKMGIRPGDQLVLTSVVSGAGGDVGRVLTIDDPSAKSVIETITHDSSVYTFTLRRRGHGVLTDWGRHVLSKLVAWQVIDGTLDVVETNSRPRWVGVGDGTQSEDVLVRELNSPLPITTGIFLSVVDAPAIYPLITWVDFTKTFGTAEISLGGAGDAVEISEVALFSDEDSGGGPGLSVTVGTHAPFAYKTFDTIVKHTGFSLMVRWGFMF